MSHIQSMAFGTDKTGLGIAKDAGIFNVDMKRKNEIITQHEVGLSKVLLARGYQIKPFQLSQFYKIFHADIQKNGEYFGTTLNPLDIMFIKTNRITDKVVEN